jgi:hypothetical protein
VGFKETENGTSGSSLQVLQFSLPILIPRYVTSRGLYTRSTPLQKYASQAHMIYASARSGKQGAIPREVNQYESNPTYLNYRPSDRRLSTKLLTTFVDRGCRVVSATDPHGRILRFLDWSRYSFLPSSSSTVLTRLSGPRSRPTASQKI